VPNEAAAEQRFAALSDGGQVQIPLAETFFSPCFGIVADRFGVMWTVFVQFTVARWLHHVLASGGFWKHKRIR
jgi:uncharacterized glyoxalase superfamily protein PhnB